MLRLGAMIASLAVLVVACATPYQSHGFTGGYQETRINDSAYLVSFAGNGYASKDRVWYFWLYRCAELTLLKGYDTFLLLPKDSAPPKQARNDSGLRPAVYRSNQSGRFIKVRGGGTVTTYYYGGGGAITNWNSSAIVVMFRAPLAEQSLYAIDARKVKAELAAYIASDGNSQPPGRMDVLRSALVTHAQIDVGDPSFGASSASNSTNSNAQPSGIQKPGRSPQEIKTTIANDVLWFQSVYRAYVKFHPDSVGEHIVLSFNITSYGSVSDCKIVRSTSEDQAFLNALKTRVSQLNFGVRDTADAAIAEIPVTFTPNDLPSSRAGVPNPANPAPRTSSGAITNAPTVMVPPQKTSL